MRLVIAAHHVCVCVGLFLVVFVHTCINDLDDLTLAEQTREQFFEVTVTEKINYRGKGLWEIYQRRVYPSLGAHSQTHTCIYAHQVVFSCPPALI